MRTSRPLYLLIGMSLLAVVLFVSFFMRMQSGRSNVPGTDLSYLQPSAIPGHLEALKSPDASARKKAATILWQMGAEAKDATPTLVQATQDPESTVRVAAVKALGRTAQGTQDAIPTLISALTDENAEVRAAAANSLTETWRWMVPSRGPAQIQSPARDEKTGQARQRGQGAAPERPSGGLGPPYAALAQKAVPVLTTALQDRDDRVCAHAAEALAETGPLAESAVPELTKVLQRPDSNARLQATLALCNIGPGAKAAVPVLVEKLRSDEADGVRVNAAAALGSIGAQPETVIPALVDAFLNDKHPDARNCAMMSISQFGSDAKLAIPLLQKAAKDAKNQSAATSKSINRLLSFLEKQS
jgi:HEAT repeat protein